MSRLSLLARDIKPLGAYKRPCGTHLQIIPDEDGYPGVREKEFSLPFKVLLGGLRTKWT